MTDSKKPSEPVVEERWDLWAVEQIRHLLVLHNYNLERINVLTWITAVSALLSLAAVVIAIM